MNFNCPASISPVLDYRHLLPHRAHELLRLELWGFQHRQALSSPRHAPSPVVFSCRHGSTPLCFFHLWFPWISMRLFAESECLYWLISLASCWKFLYSHFPLRWALKAYSVMKIECEEGNTVWSWGKHPSSKIQNKTKDKQTWCRKNTNKQQCRGQRPDCSFRSLRFITYARRRLQKRDMGTRAIAHQLAT